MITEQREKEFLFDLELLYHRYNLVIEADIGLGHPVHSIKEADCGDEDCTTKFIESHIDDLRRLT